MSRGLMMVEPVQKLQHDEAVRLVALGLVSQGFDVQARVEGWFDLPEFINGYRPDIVAKWGEYVVIIEVKKGAVDWPKISAFQQFSDQNKSFDVKVVSPEEVIGGFR